MGQIKEDVTLLPSCIDLLRCGCTLFFKTRQNDSRIEFIRAGDAVKSAGWLKGELKPFEG